MSRNLGARHCGYCDCEPVLLEDARPLRREECRGYAEYAGMLVANAICPDCHARYLAWMGDTPYGGTGLDPTESGIYDLSFRSSFSDTPGKDDLPAYHIVHHLILERTPFEDPHPPNTLRKMWREGWRQ